MYCFVCIRDERLIPPITIELSLRVVSDSETTIHMGTSIKNKYVAMEKGVWGADLLLTELCCT